MIGQTHENTPWRIYETGPGPGLQIVSSSLVLFCWENRFLPSQDLTNITIISLTPVKSESQWLYEEGLVVPSYTVYYIVVMFCSVVWVQSSALTVPVSQDLFQLLWVILRDRQRVTGWFTYCYWPTHNTHWAQDWILVLTRNDVQEYSGNNDSGYYGKNKLFISKKQVKAFHISAAYSLRFSII